MKKKKKRGSLQDLIDINKEKGLSLSQNEILDITLGICQGLYQLHHYTPESSDTPVPLAHRVLLFSLFRSN